MSTNPQKLRNLGSSRRFHTFWGMVVVLLCAVFLSWLIHGEWLGSANDHLLGGSPDGFKNYMTTAWHVRHDSSYVHYGGMNYPYGEHVLFTDNQPILSAAMQWWSRNVSDLGGRTVGVMNLFQVFTQLLGACILYLLFRRLHLAVWYAVPVALGMTFLSPQYLRFDGHFGLSHVFFFPLLLLLLSEYEHRYSRRYQSLLIGILVWVGAQLHFYYFGLAALFLGLYTMFQILVDPSWRNLRVRISHLVVMVILPFALLNIWVQWSDYAADRSSQPYGFTGYIGMWEGIFLPPSFFPMHQWINESITKIRDINSEARAYAGMAVFLFTLWLIFSGFKLFGKTWDEQSYHRVHKRYLRGVFTAAFVLTVFSCGFPYAVKGMEWMIDYFGPLRQFRSMGRFTWVYFYAGNLLLFYGAWNFYKHFKGFKGGKAVWLRWVVLFLPLAMLTGEAYVMQTQNKIRFTPNPLGSLAPANVAGPWLKAVDWSRYQALLPLPYYHMGSENVWIDFDYLHFQKVQTAAMYSGVPDMGVNLSRTSVAQTVRSIQLAFEQGEIPQILLDLPNERPIAILLDPKRWDGKVKAQGAVLLQKAKPVFQNEDLQVYELYPDSLRAAIRAHVQTVRADVAARGQHAIKGGWMSTSPDPKVYYQSYDSLKNTAIRFQGGGAIEANMGDTLLLFEGSLPKGQYTIAFWVYAAKDWGVYNEIKFFENTLSDGHEINLLHHGTHLFIQQIIDGWALVEIPFDVYEEGSVKRIFMNKPKTDNLYYLDEVLIKPLNTEVFKTKDNWVVRNNFWYR